ncbi:hypothetical protein BDF21DRAFT_152572 [Thamnidium elegans]|nr:hypothetical protein BDF21DRAFT_152572 [Thamnidium elegans]
MDSIKLERIEPFNKSGSKQKPAMSNQLIAFNKPNTFNKPVVVNRPNTFNKSTVFNKPTASNKVTAFSNSAYKQQYSEVNGLFQKLRTKICEPQPIPPQVIPIMAFSGQVEKYENKFLNDSKVVDESTIQSLMEPFSEVDASGGRNSKYGKFIFLSRFFHKIINQTMVKKKKKALIFIYLVIIF